MRPTKEDLKKVSKEWLFEKLDRALTAGEKAADIAEDCGGQITDLELDLCSAMGALRELLELLLDNGGAEEWCGCTSADPPVGFDTDVVCGYCRARKFDAGMARRESRKK